MHCISRVSSKGEKGGPHLVLPVTAVTDPVLHAGQRDGDVQEATSAAEKMRGFQDSSASCCVRLIRSIDTIAIVVINDILHIGENKS